MSHVKRETIRDFFKDNNLELVNQINGEEYYNFSLLDFELSDFSQKTAIFDVLYRSIPAVLKIYVLPEGNSQKFVREVRGYQILNEVGDMDPFTPELLMEGSSPFLYLMIEKVKGNIVGSWKSIALSDTNLLEVIFGIITEVNRIHPTPEELFRTSLSDPDYFFQKSADIANNISILSAQSIWQVLIDSRPRFEQLFSKEGLGLIHGDFHPGNLFLTSDGKCKVIDFESLSFGHIEYDIASFYFASLQDSNTRNIVLQKIESYFGLKNNRESFFLFNFYTVWIIFFKSGLSRKLDHQKLMNELRLRVNNLYNV